MTRRYLHDCEYAGITEIRTGLRETVRLKKNLYSHVIPFISETINAPPLLPKKEAAPRPDSGKRKAALRARPYNADQGPPTRRKLDDRDRQSRNSLNRTPLDFRLVQRNQSPPQNTPQNRYVVDGDGTVYPGNPANDRAIHSGPMADSNFRDKYDNSLRDRSMSSERSRDSWPREAETTGPDRNRDPRRRDAHQDRSYSSLRAKSPTRGRGAKGKGSRASNSSTASAFPTFQNLPITIVPRALALRYLKIEKALPPPTEVEAREISDHDLAYLLRKPSLGPHDRANHETICGQLREMYIDHMIGIEMCYERDQPTVWLNLFGHEIPPEQMDNITFKYFLPPEKDQATLGNYWWVVRLRPQGEAKKYEYMINKDYSFSRMSWDFAQHRTSQLAAKRWYYEGPIEKTLASCLYPYHQYCMPRFGHRLPSMQHKPRLERPAVHGGIKRQHLEYI